MMAERYRIGDLMVDTGDGTVTRRRETLSLSPLSFDLLAALARRAPHVVRRQELLETVWPNEFVNDETLSQRVRLLRESLGDATEEPRYVASLRGWGYKLIAPVERLPGQAGTIRSLAVLPLANLTGDPQQEYFADGMTEALISALAKVRALKVISRTSVMHYKHIDKPLPQIARELGADAVIEGTVLLTGERVSVSAQLVCAATDEHLWAESYDRDLSDVISLHADLARAIAREVRAIVTPDEEERLEKSPRVDPLAQHANLRARYFFTKLTAACAQRAIAEFDKAVGLDPSFAEAHAGLAQVCFERAVPLATGLSVRDQRELLARAKAAATKALDIDGALAEAHAVLGMIFLFLDWNWREAERALERALELDSNSSYAHAYCAVLASTRLDSTRTLRELRCAVELDPLNLLLHAEAGELCYWIRDYARAVEFASQTLELDPSFPRAHFVLGRVFEAQGRIDEAITEYQQAGVITTREATTARRALQRSGAAGYHRWALAARLGAMGSRPTGGSGVPRTGDQPFFRARIHARLGGVDEALTYLEQAYEERECMLVLLKAQEWWDPLRSDARFQDLVRRVGIP
jgi:TolB-like protein/Flp pilus assembly protein TadD